MAKLVSIASSQLEEFQEFNVEVNFSNKNNNINLTQWRMTGKINSFASHKYVKTLKCATL